MSTQCPLVHVSPLPSLSLFSLPRFLFSHTPALSGLGIPTRWARCLVPVPQCPHHCHGFGTVSNMVSKCAPWTASGTSRARMHGLCRNCPRVGSQQRWPAFQQCGSLACHSGISMVWPQLAFLASFPSLSPALTAPGSQHNSLFPVSVPLDSVPSA